MKLPPRMRHARNLGDASPAVNRPVSGKSVGLQVSAIPFQEPERSISRAGFRVVEDGAFVSNVDPESALLRPLLLFAFFARRLFHSAFGIQHAHLGVVGKDPRSFQYLRLQCVSDRRVEVRDSRNPIRQGLSRDLQTMTGEDRLLAIEWVWSAYLPTTTCASRPGPGRPLSIGPLGGSAVRTPSWHFWHAYFGRIVRRTNKDLGLVVERLRDLASDLTHGFCAAMTRNRLLSSSRTVSSRGR